MDLVYFALVVSALIFVHEIGHFVLAKLFGVKVLMFSIGFGPKILRLRGRETEYCIGLLPLGGFVKMLEENRQEPVLPEDKHRTFDAQPLYKRVIIVLAGPAMNILFPVLLYLAVFVGESGFIPPTVGVVLPNHAAAGQLEPGDRVLEIDGTHISTYVEMVRIVRNNPGRELSFKVLRDKKHAMVQITPEERVERKPLGIIEKVGAIGVGPHRPAAVIGISDTSSPAYRAGLRTFDLITEVRGQPVRTFAELEAKLAENRGETVPVTYLRPAHVPQALGGLSDLYVYESGLAALTPDSVGQGLLKRTGIESADLYIADVMPGSNEWKAGLRPGDRVVAIDNVEMLAWPSVREALRNTPNQPHRVAFTRRGERMSTDLQVQVRTFSAEQGVPGTVILGARNWSPHLPIEHTGTPSIWHHSLPEALDETRDAIHFIVVGIVKIAKGELSLSTIGGPITVYDVVVQERRRGTSYLLWAMALISINLGLINLLPIPLLDGGHLLFFLFEAILRRPLPLRTREILSLIGFLMVVVIGGLALKNDVEKRWDIITAQASELIG